MSNEGEWGYEDWDQPRDGDQPKWMPDRQDVMKLMQRFSVPVDSMLCATYLAEEVARIAVEKALAEQEARHRREVIETRIDVLESVQKVTPVIQYEEHLGELRAELAALDKEANGE